MPVDKTCETNYTRVPMEVCRDALLSPNAKALYLFGCDHPKDWEFHLEYIAEGMRWSTNRVKRTLAELTQRGLVTGGFFGNNKKKNSLTFWLTPKKTEFLDHEKILGEFEKMITGTFRHGEYTNHTPKTLPSKRKRAIDEAVTLAQTHDLTLKNVFSLIVYCDHKKINRANKDGRTVFDWLLRPDNMERVINGGYDEERNATGWKKIVEDMQDRNRKKSTGFPQQ